MENQYALILHRRRAGETLSPQDKDLYIQWLEREVDRLTGQDEWEQRQADERIACREHLAMLREGSFDDPVIT